MWHLQWTKFFSSNFQTSFRKFSGLLYSNNVIGWVLMPLSVRTTDNGLFREHSVLFSILCIRVIDYMIISCEDYLLSAKKVQNICVQSFVSIIYVVDYLRLHKFFEQQSLQNVVEFLVKKVCLLANAWNLCSFLQWFFGQWCKNSLSY